MYLEAHDRKVQTTRALNYVKVDASEELHLSMSSKTLAQYFFHAAFDTLHL